MGSITNKYILEYIDLVESKKIRVCDEQLKLIEFIKKEFDSGEIYTDDDLMDRYMKLQRFFPFKLFPWQKFVFCLHMCTFRKSDNTVRFPEMLLYMGRGSGKNGYIEFEDFASISPVNGIKGYHCSTFAAGIQNACTGFNELHDMLDSEKETFKGKFKWNKERIVNVKTQSEITYHTSNPKTKDGGRQGKVNLDEIHSYEDFKLWNVVLTGLGKVKNARVLYTSTLGFNRDGPLDMLLNRAHDILYNGAKDGGFLPFICRIEKAEDIVNPNCWEMANPSLPYFPELRRSYEREVEMYKKNPGENTSFPVKRCNFLVDPSSRFAQTTDIKACCTGTLPQEMVEQLKGSTAYIGFDFAQINDMMSVGYLVEGQDDTIIWVTHSWISKNSNDFNRISYDLTGAERRGELTIVDKNTLTADLVMDWLIDMKNKLKLKVVCGGADMHKVYLIEQAITERLGMPVAKRNKTNDYGQKSNVFYINRLSETDAVIPLILQKMIDHKIYCGDNGLMRWFFGNIAKTETDKGMVISKIEPRTRKTDGFSALQAAYATMCIYKSKNRVVKRVFRMSTGD